MPRESLEHKQDGDNQSTTNSQKRSLDTRPTWDGLHGWYQVILRLTLDDIVKGVNLRAWLLAHAYSFVKPNY